MEFGRGTGDTFGIPTLAPEHPVTTELLRTIDTHEHQSPAARRALELFPEEPAQVRIGLSTWGDKAYRGTIFPADTRSADFLRRYGAIFSTVELSATFYGMPDDARFTSWREAVPETFRFLPKVSQAITHRHALIDAQQGLRDFLDRTAALGGRRGPVLLQMPPRFAPDAVSGDRLAAALAVLQRQVAVELRHPAWFRDGEDGAPPPAAEILREYGATLAVTDTVGARDVVHAILTSPTLVLRFVAAGDSAVDAVRIDQWADRIADWLERGLRDAYIFVHGDEPVSTLDLARRFSRRLEAMTADPAVAEILGPAEAPGDGAENADGSPVAAAGGMTGVSGAGDREVGAPQESGPERGTTGSANGREDSSVTRYGPDGDGQLSLF